MPFPAALSIWDAPLGIELLITSMPFGSMLMFLIVR
jgi:hypothetical protein